jgi:hypothetical protein
MYILLVIVCMTGTMLCTSLALASTPNRFLMSLSYRVLRHRAIRGKAGINIPTRGLCWPGHWGISLGFHEFYKEIKLTLRPVAGSLHRLTVGHRPLCKPKSQQPLAENSTSLGIIASQTTVAAELAIRWSCPKRGYG